jgi:hypothetical protein
MAVRTWDVKALLLLLLIPGAVLAGLPGPGELGSIPDPRYCGEPARHPDGRIKRSRAVLRAFAKIFPCPANLKPVPHCPGWAIDHTIPLATGGCDSIANLTWLPTAIKSCASPACKDRWERSYHAHPRSLVDLKGSSK